MLELRWLQVPETTTKPPTLQYRIHQPVVDVGGHLCPGEWTDWTDVPTVVGEPSDTAPPPAAQQQGQGQGGGEVVAWRVPVVQSPFGEWLDHGVRDGLVLVMHRGTHGWKAAGQGHALLAHQLYVKNVEPLCATSHEVAVVGLSGGGWRTVWARSDDDVTHPAPPSAPVVPDWITGDGMQGIKAEAHFLTQHKEEAVQRAGKRLLDRADKIIAALYQPPSAPVGVDEVAWRDAFIAERARRYRSEGMKIEQARIHAETDADLTTALTAQQPAAVSDDDGAEPGEPCESGLPDCGPAVAWDCEGIGACERCARELGWIATPHREPATPP